jgi:hypothetical protein
MPNPTHLLISEARLQDRQKEVVPTQRHQPVHGTPVPLADGCQKLRHLFRDRTLRALRHRFSAFL